MQKSEKTVHRKTVTELCRIAKQNESKDKRISAREEILKRLDSEKLSAEDLLVLACYDLDEDLALQAVELLTSNYRVTTDMLLEACKNGMTAAVKGTAKEALREKIESEGLSTSKLRDVVLSHQPNEIKRAAAAELASRQNLDVMNLAATICVCTDSKSSRILFEKLKEIQKPGSMQYIAASCKFSDIAREATEICSQDGDGEYAKQALRAISANGRNEAAKSMARQNLAEAGDEIEEARRFREAEARRIENSSFFKKVVKFFRSF